jgi:hypothetical protein
MATQIKSNEEEAAKTIDVKKAVRIAIAYFLELYPGYADSNVMLEEVEQSEDGLYWLITMGFDTKDKERPKTIFDATSYAKLMGQQQPTFTRHYKVLKVDMKTGKIISMKIRSLK